MWTAQHILVCDFKAVSECHAGLVRPPHIPLDWRLFILQWYVDRDGPECDQNDPVGEGMLSLCVCIK